MCYAWRYELFARADLKSVPVFASTRPESTVNHLTTSPANRTRNRTRVTARVACLALAVIGSLLVGLPFASAQDRAFLVIVHPDNPVTTLSKADVSGFFLKKVSRWSQTRQAAQPVDQVASAPVRESFSADIHGRSVDRIKNYWQRRIFSGRDVPPPELAGDGDVVEFVRSNPGSIGYISAATALTGVKAVTIAE